MHGTHRHNQAGRIMYCAGMLQSCRLLRCIRQGGTRPLSSAQARTDSRSIEGEPNAIVKLSVVVVIKWPIDQECAFPGGVKCKPEKGFRIKSSQSHRFRPYQAPLESGIESSFVASYLVHSTWSGEMLTERFVGHSKVLLLLSCS